LKAFINNRFKSNINIYLFLINYKVSKKLTFYLNISFNKKTKIWKKLINNKKYSIDLNNSFSSFIFIIFILLA
jgi:hypothetical protein